MEFKSVLEFIEQRGVSRANERGTYTDENGVVRCSVCHDPVRQYIDGVGERTVTCSCDKAEEEAEKRRKAAREARNRVSASAYFNPHYDGLTFTSDDQKNADASKKCRSYAAHFTELRSENIGLLLTGTVGAGKSFYAACVVNALIASGTPALMLTTSNLIDALKNDRKAVCNELNSFPLIALDDLGAERGTDYAAELLESFINSRYVANKPLIVTTNLTTRDMKECDDIRYRRIFDRIKAMCAVPVVIVGESRRAEQQERKAQRAREIMGV